MQYPHFSYIVSASANVTSLIGVSSTAAAANKIAVDHAGPGIFMFAAEAISAATDGSAQIQLSYTDLAGSARTFSGSVGYPGGAFALSAATPQAASGTAGCLLQIFPQAGSTVSWAIGTSSATAGASLQFRYWVTYLGGDAPMGMLQG